MHKRFEVGPHAVPALPRHVRLQFDDLRQKWVVLSPERVLWPDDISVDILKRCDGSASIAMIAGALAKDYDASEDEVNTDVLEFLQDWSDKRLVHFSG